MKSFQNNAINLSKKHALFQKDSVYRVFPLISVFLRVRNTHYLENFFYIEFLLQAKQQTRLRGRQSD
jgi:hypothetical protein